MNPPFYCKSFLQIRREEMKECRKFITTVLLTAFTAGAVIGIAIAKCENMRLIDATSPQMAYLLVGIAQHNDNQQKGH